MVPRVSIGMPVYNGQRYVADAIDSILSQTYEDFELVISDNGSDDQTESICRAKARGDSRVRYYRHNHNQGAAWNFNRVLKLAKGEFFKWQAHDDLIAPTFLEKCVDAMDANPEVVLCQSRVRLIDAHGANFDNYTLRVCTDAESPHQRLREVVSDWMCFAIFGLMRRVNLETVGLLGNYAHADGVFLARLCLQGPFCEIGEYLFSSRRHSAQSAGVMRDKYMYAAWFDPANAGRIVLPNWRINAEFFKSISSSNLVRGEKMRCYAVWAREAVSDRRRLLRDLAAATRMALRRKRLRPIDSTMTKMPNSQGDRS